MMDIIRAWKDEEYRLSLTEEWIESRSRIRPSLWATEVVDEHINGLNERGFANPQKILASSPPIFGLSFEYIDAKRNGLRGGWIPQSGKDA